jgi:hypothetical protein
LAYSFLYLLVKYGYLEEILVKFNKTIMSPKGINYYSKLAFGVFLF